jgi:hypothetical protein
MYVKLDQGRITNAAEAVDLTRLDDQNVTCSGFEFLPVDVPETAAFPHELDFIVRMTVGPWTTPRRARAVRTWWGVQQEHFAPMSVTEAAAVVTYLRWKAATGTLHEHERRSVSEALQSYWLGRIR